MELIEIIDKVGEIDEIIIGIGTDNTVGKALFNTIQDNQLEECEYFE